jgi:diguanylate cyclase (GGDEF)-like protein
MRLVDRRQTSLRVALATGLVAFQAPLSTLINAAARDVQIRAGIGLLPGLAGLLAVAFGIRWLRRRQHAASSVWAPHDDMERLRARNAELEQLVVFGRALGGALEPAAARQVFWRFMPVFAGHRELWMLTRGEEGWESLVHDATAVSARNAELIETIASSALLKMAAAPATDGVIVETDLCFPLVTGDKTVGVVGVQNIPELSLASRETLATAAALMAIAIRHGQLLAQCRESGIRDGLTGCFNRAYAIEALGAELRRSKRTLRPVSALLFDIDELKAINDRCGHLTGDAVLAAVGARLSSMLRGTDVKCRYGDDEFLVVLPDTMLQGAEHVAASLVEALSKMHVTSGGFSVSPTVSIGVTVAPRSETNPNIIIANVEEALYQAKRSGRNQYVSTPLATAV